MLEELSATVLDTVHLAVEDGGSVLYLDKLPGSRGAEMRSRIGYRMPLTRTGGGKALLLDAADRWAGQYAADEARLPVAGRRGDPDAFIERMRGYARTGAAMDLENNEPGIRCIAAPIRDASRAIVGGGQRRESPRPPVRGPCGTPLGGAPVSRILRSGPSGAELSGRIDRLLGMVRPDPALRRLMRDMGKLLQPYGFHGSEPRWVRIEPGGVAAVGRTRVSRVWTDGQQVLRFGLHLSATPISWWEFDNWRNARLGLPAVPLEEATGPDLVDTHGLADSHTAVWLLRVDPDQPGGHALQDDIDTIRAELPRRVHAYARRAIQLADSERYLEELLAQPDPRIGLWEAIVVLLAGHGPGPRLDHAIRQLQECVAERETPDYTREIIEYARTRAVPV